MAKRIENVTPLRGRPAIYPWAEWLDGGAWRIRRGSDFEIAPKSMAAIIRQRAAREGMTATCRHPDAETVEFQVFSEEAA